MDSLRIEEEPLDSIAKRLNILCDKIAGKAAQDVICCTYPPTETISPPYPGLKALLRIGTTWITSHVPNHVTSTYHSSAIREYCMAKYSWSKTTFNSIYWDGIARARKRGTATQQMHTSKLMHGWLPVNHIVGRYTGLTQCPGCTNTDKILEHLFHCPHPHMKQARSDSICALWRFLLRSNYPQ